jgi:hypothetical protein
MPMGVWGRVVPKTYKIFKYCHNFLFGLILQVNQSFLYIIIAFTNIQYEKQFILRSNLGQKPKK